MKLIIKYYNSFRLRPFHKFSTNLFFIKHIYAVTTKFLKYSHIFAAIKKILRVRIFKFNYSLYFTCILTFLIINILIQILMFLL